MRRQAKNSIKRHADTDGLFHTVILFICFVLSGLFGCLAVASAGEAGFASIVSYFDGYAEVLKSGAAVQPTLPTVIWELCRWPVLTLLLGFTAFGAVAIPAVFCVRGFLLAYSVASFFRVFGFSGMPAALALFGMTAFASIPVLFCIGSLSFQSALGLSARMLERQPAAVSFGESFLSLIPCGILLALAIVLQWSLMPQLLLYAVEMLPEII